MKGKITKATVSWGVKWPGPVDYSMLMPSVSLEAEIQEDEPWEVIDDVRKLAFRHMIECLSRGIEEMEEAFNDQAKEVPWKSGRRS